MRGAVATSLLLLLFAAGCWGGAPPATPEGGPQAAPTPVATPPWVPPLTAQQQALRQRTDKPVKSPAVAVFPDLARFGYAPPRPLAGGDDALQYTRMVTQVLNDSPRYYVLSDAPAELANLVAQYGPPPEEPDGYQVVQRGEGALGGLAPAPQADAARAAAQRAEELERRGDVGAAVAAYRAAAQKFPGVPALPRALADALRKAGAAREAEAAYREAARVDPTFAPAQLGIAEMCEQRNDLPAARRALAEALAYHPPNPKAIALARRLGGAGSPPDGGWTDPPPASAREAARVAPFAVFLDVDDAGAVHVATGRTDAAQIYGGCRAIMRHEPDLRAQLFHQPPETPYFLTMAEEVICLEAALGAYLAGRSGGAPSEPEMEALFRLAGEEGLSGYALFEILGQHRPERARAAPPDVHRDVVGYVERHVFGRRAAPPEGIYTAAR